MERKTSDMNMTLSSLEATHSLIEEAPDVMGQHLPSLLSVLLQLSQESPYMVREGGMVLFVDCIFLESENEFTEVFGSVAEYCISSSGLSSPIKRY